MNLRFPLALISIATLTSCNNFGESVSKATRKINNPLKGLAMMNKNDLLNFKLNDLRTNTPPIVKVRPEDLQEMKTGEERYLAYHREKELYYIQSAEGIEFLPQDFDPSILSGSSELSPTGVLPPMYPASTTDPAPADGGEE